MGTTLSESKKTLDFTKKSIKTNRKERTNRTSLITVVTITFVVSVLAIFGWFFDVESLKSIIPGGSTMKFNTALLFFLLAVNLTLHRTTLDRFKIISVLINLAILIISTLSLAQYIFSTSLGIDNFFVVDRGSSIYPGRMSPSTAICFVLTAVGFLGLGAYKKISKFLVQPILMFVTLMSLVSTVSYILGIPSESKVFFLQTMAINTSLLFLLLSIVLQLEIRKSELDLILKGKLSGSKMFVRTLPITIILPLALSFLFLWGLEAEIFDVSFGISLLTVLLVLIGIFYVYILAKGLNEADLVRNKLEKALKIYNKELEQFKEGLDQVTIVTIMDDEGRITYANDQYCDISGYNREEILGRVNKFSAAHDQQSDFLDELWKKITSGKIWTGEIVGENKQGEKYWEKVAVVPFMDDSGKVVEYMTMGQDVTLQKLADELVHIDYVKKLEYKNKELEQFVYIASHDLQEPLRSLKSFSGLLLEDYADKLDETGEKGLQFISESADRMSELIRDLLDYSRIGRDRSLTMVDCNKIMDMVLNDLLVTIKNKKAQIEFGELPKVKGYETELRLLFQNLISNALKFHKEGESPKISVSADKKEDDWLFQFKDHGIGIKKEHIEKIFIIFQRLHSKSVFPGTGIGLANCRKVVEMHGGTIWVESEPDSGSTFYFTIKD